MIKSRAASFTDSYKVGHIWQYPRKKLATAISAMLKGTQFIYSNYTPRNATHAKVLKEVYNNTVVVAGIQLLIKAYFIDFWNDTFFNVPKEIACRHYKRRCQNLLGKDFDVKHFEDLHDLGYLPLEIRALEEGTLSPIGVPVLTIHNTHEDFFWLTNYVETAMSNMLWKSIDAATVAYFMRKILTKFQQETGSEDFMIPYQGHDFSMRGLSGGDDVVMTGLGHQTSFIGTDNLVAIDAAEDYYGANSDLQHLGESVDATEHSVMCIRGETGEFRLVEGLLKDRPTGIFSMVSDGFDYWNMLDVYLPILKPLIMARDGKLVIRPDSGDPADIICGEAHAVPDLGSARLDRLWQKGVRYVCKRDTNGEWVYYNLIYDAGSLVKPATAVINLHPTLEMKGSYEVLWETFGGTYNFKGFRHLDSHIGLIYGDSINPERLNDILTRLMDRGFASTPVFGFGSYLYEFTTRDAFGMAMKATAAIVDDEFFQVYKDPKTGDGMKKSLKGYIRVFSNQQDGSIGVYDQQDSYEGGLLLPVFQNGKLLRETTLSAIRKKLWNWDDTKAVATADIRLAA